MHKKIILSFLSILILSSCGSDPKDTAVYNDPSYYKGVWKETFQKYQTSATEVPKKGKYNFEFSVLVSDKNGVLEKFSNYHLDQPFQSLSISIFGNHDFESQENPSMSSNIKAYLNKRSSGKGDVDISLDIDKEGKVTYMLNNMESGILDFFGIDSETKWNLIALTNENKGKPLESTSESALLKEIISTFQEKSKDDPLYKNSKEEERKIIESFLTREVIEIMSGSTDPNGTEALYFTFNSNNCIDFFNDVAKIIWNGNENKNFDNDREFFKNFSVNGTLFIKDKRIIDSDILLQVPLNGTDASGKSTFDILTLQNRLKLPNPEIFNLDLTSKITSESTPNNTLQLRLIWSIK